MMDRRRQTNARLVATVLIVALLVAMSVGAVVLAGAAPVAAQSHETGTAGDGATTGAPPGDGSSENATTSSDNASSSNESGDGSGSDGDPSDRTEPVLPNTSSGSGAGTGTNASETETGATTENASSGGNESDNATSETSGSETYTAGEDDDDSMFSVSIDPVGLLISFFEPFFTFGTSLLVGMAEALQSSTQYPMQDGSVAISGEPDGELMSLLYEYWYGVSLVAGAAIWLINTIVLYLLTMVWPATPTYQELVIARKEAWLKLFLIPFSWALGTIILFTASFALNAVPLDPNTIAPDTSSIAANNAAAGISVLLFYAFGGAFALAMAFTFFVTWVFLYIIFPAMPILIAMSVPKAWIMKGVAEAFESILQLFPSAAFFPLPAVVVLSVGYSILGAIENLLPGPAEWGAVPVSAVAIIVIWLLAFIASIYLFWFKKVGSSAGAIIAGSVGLGAISSALGRLGGGVAAGGGAAAGSAAGSAVGSSASALPGSADNAINGHALGSGDSGKASGALGAGSASGLSAGSTDLDSSGEDAPATAGTSTGTNPSGTALPGGESSPSPSPSVAASASGSGPAAAADAGGSIPGRIPVDDPTITPVDSKDQLPDQEYRVGYFTGTGPGNGIEFQKMLDAPRSTKTVTGDVYARVNESYEERDLFVRGQEDHQFYDVNPIQRSGSGNGGLDLSEAEQNAESRSTVSDSREI